MSLAELLPFVLIGGVFWLLVIRPGKKRRDEHNRMMSTLVPGARIMTTAGLFGTVVAVDHKQVSVEIAPAVVVQMVPQAIANVVVPDDLAEEDDPFDALEADLAADDLAADPLAADLAADPLGGDPRTAEPRADGPSTRPNDRDSGPEQGIARG